MTAPSALVCPFDGTPVTPHHFEPSTSPNASGTGAVTTVYPSDFRCEGECWRSNDTWHPHVRGFEDAWFRENGP